jgi:hypothetical protein
MRAERTRLALLPSAISLAVLLYSPLCGLSCAAFDCSPDQTTIKSAERREESRHCHQEQQSTDSNAPEPPQDSGNCPAHTDTIAVVSSVVRVPTLLLQSAQAVSVIPAGFSSPRRVEAARTADGGPFRSPPRPALTSVYRI